MVLAIIFILYVSVLVFDYKNGFTQRNIRENIYYILILIVSFTVVLLSGMDKWTFDPVNYLIEAFDLHK